MLAFIEYVSIILILLLFFFYLLEEFTFNISSVSFFFETLTIAAKH